MKRLVTLFFLVFSVGLTAQEPLPFDQFLSLVYENHPVAKQAKLTLERSEWEIVGAKGFLDPKLVSNYETKDFKEKDYYDLWNSYLEVPTPINIDLKAGYERNSGVFLNPQNSLPSEGLYYAGVSVPLGQGLFLNDRVYQRRTGMLKGEQLKIESEYILNNLLLDASYGYWQWVATLRNAEVIRQGLSLAEERFLAVKQAVINGDKAAIDTVESLIMVQKLRNDLSKQLMDSLNQTLSINNLLWEVEEGTFYTPNSLTSFGLSDLSVYEDFAIREHPELRDIQNKGEQLDNDRKYYAEQIKPELDVNYNFLLQEGNPDNQNFALNNYKAGVSFSVPLFLRKERSKLQMSKIKLSENDLKMDQKSREIINKVRMAYNQTVVTDDLVSQQRQVVDNYMRMLQGEQQKFNNGESSIFLLNSRQNKLLEGQLKLIELEISYRMYLAKLFWQSGYFPTLVR